MLDSSGPEGKVRGTAKQLCDKYMALGRDAMSSGDRVAAERFLQHAEHYRRILIEKESSSAAFASKKRVFPPQTRQSKGKTEAVSESKESDETPVDKEPEATQEETQPSS